MKIGKTTDKRIFIISAQEACEITKNPYATFIINGNDYALVRCLVVYKSDMDNIEIYEATFISKELIETEIEMVSDKEC